MFNSDLAPTQKNLITKMKTIKANRHLEETKF